MQASAQTLHGFGHGDGVHDAAIDLVAASQRLAERERLGVVVVGLVQAFQETVGQLGASRGREREGVQRELCNRGGCVEPSMKKTLADPAANRQPSRVLEGS